MYNHINYIPGQILSRNDMYFSVNNFISFNDVFSSQPLAFMNKQGHNLVLMAEAENLH